MKSDFLNRSPHNPSHKQKEYVGKTSASCSNSNHYRRATTPELMAEIGMLKQNTDVGATTTPENTKRQNLRTHSRRSIRDLTDEEIEKLIEKVKSPKEDSPRSKHKYYPNLKSLMERQQSSIKCTESTSPLISPTNRNPGILRKTSQDETFILDQENGDDLNKTYSITTKDVTPNDCGIIHKVEFDEAGDFSVHVPQLVDNVRMEKYRKPKATWVEVSEPHIEFRSESRVTRTPAERWNDEDIPDDVSLQCHMSARLMTEAAYDNGSYINVHSGEDNVNPDNYILDDSDSEFDVMTRKHYTKYTDSKHLPHEMLYPTADEDGSLAEFIAIEVGVIANRLILKILIFLLYFSRVVCVKWM